MKKTFCSFFLLAIFALTSFAQRHTISGYIIDKESGEKLYSANIYDLRTKQGTISNEYGFFSLSLRPDSVDLVVSFIGYNAYNLKFVLDKDINMNIVLDPVIQLAEVTITDNKADQTVKDVQMSIIEMPVAQIKQLPVFMGEADVMKTLQLMPGVQSGSEGSSGLYVRGGGPDQNLVLLDGVPVYNADHLFGFFSVFNPDAISSVSLIKGGFPAPYGGRLSSVIDIRLKEGNMRKFTGEASIGTIASKFTFEGPIIKDKTSFIVSARRTYIDVLAAPIVAAVNQAVGNDSKFRAGYYFYDANIKVNHSFSEKDRIFVSAYLGRDKAYVKDKYRYLYEDTINTVTNNTGLYWGNITTALRWNHVFSKRLFANTTLIYSDYKFDTYMEYGEERGKNIATSYEYDYFSGINDNGVKLDFNYYPSPRHEIRFGANYLYHTFKPGVTTFKVTADNTSIKQDFGNKPIYANEYYAYVDDNISLGSRFKANVGLHYSGFAVKDKLYQSWQPRVSMRYLASEKFSIKAAFTTMEQYIHLLTNSTIGLPTDLWLPSTDSIRPQKSMQGALGFAYNYKDQWDFTLEGFYKSMDNLIEYKEGASFFDIGQDWESKVEIGKGWSYGLEFLARKNLGKFTGWIGYTLSWSWRQFENLNFGESFPYKYDRRHDVSIALLYKYKDNIDFGLTWVYGTGNAITLAVARYEDLNAIYSMDEFNYYYVSDVEHYNNRNSYRTPAYHRLDLSANFHKKIKIGERTWSVGLYNAYSRQNPFYLYFGHNNFGQRVLNQVSLFPIIPSVRYSVKF
ncbi:MAG: TonB-dependent receptor plug domain-containing protein [Bacteroidales bacterium]|nr:TonB-dependent receptor plug domain-containing protein [Bacteroidales bacterium]